MNVYKARLVVARDQKLERARERLERSSACGRAASRTSSYRRPIAAICAPPAAVSGGGGDATFQSFWLGRRLCESCPDMKL